MELLKAKLALLNEEYEVITTENESLMTSNQGLSTHLETAEQTAAELHVTRQTAAESARQLEQVREQMAANKRKSDALDAAMEEVRVTLAAVHDDDDADIADLTSKKSNVEAELRARRNDLTDCTATWKCLPARQD